MLLWIVVLGELLLMVPLFEAVFVDFRMRLPLVTDAIIVCSHWCGKYWYVLVIQVPMIAAGVAVPTWLIRHHWRKGPLGAVWCFAMLLLPAAVAFLVWFGCYLPYEKLLEGLAAQKG
jgi:type II secretory pathway component PulF